MSKDVNYREFVPMI